MNNRLAIEYYNEGLRHAKARDWEKALDSLNKAVAEDPKHVNAYNVLGKVYAQKGELDIARRCWRKALKIDPGNVTARQCLEAAGGRLGRLQTRTLLWLAAVFILLAALVITNLVSLHRIGDLKTELKQAKATASDAKNSELKPSDTESGVQDEADQESTPVGVPVVERSPVAKVTEIKTSSQVSEVYDLALADCSSGRYDQAIEGFRRVLKYPSFHQLKDNAQYWLAECYYAQKKYGEALAEFQKVKRDFPRSNKVFDAEIKVAYTYCNLGNVKQAEQKLLQISKNWPDQQYQPQIAALSEKIRSSQSE